MPLPFAVHRKVAVPVPDGYTWPEFLQQVRSKLKIVGVKEIFFASVSTEQTGMRSALHAQPACAARNPCPRQPRQLCYIGPCMLAGDMHDIHGLMCSHALEL